MNPIIPVEEISLRPNLSFLSQEDKEKIHRAVLQILSEIGMKIFHDEALALLKDAGCSVSEERMVKIPGELFQQALARHFAEGAKARPQVQEMPQHPTFFTKGPTTVTGPCDPVPLHAGVTEKLDWEVELGVIIGRGGRNIAEADAMKQVFGYTVINDVSAREVQRQHGQQWFKGKSLDGSCPMGPWIVTADEVPDPHVLRVTCRVNGVTKQDANTRQMYFRIPRIIAELSAGLTLEPGDVISTGTPAGVGHARTPPEFMAPGDLLETEVEGIGLLRNRIVTAKR